MALIQCNLHSEIMRTQVLINIYSPCDLPPEVGFNAKATLTLLHGYSGSGIDWFNMTAAQRYAADNGLFVICPSCQNYFYQDSMFGAWKTFVTEEMPLLLSRMFKFPQEREKNYIAGLSMGGYGAMYLGLSRPDLYAACASFSGAIDLQILTKKMQDPSMQAFGKVLFDGKETLPDYKNIHHLLTKTSELPPEKQPKILLTCGYQDNEGYFIKDQNDAIFEHMRNLKFANAKRMEWKGGHLWAFWDRSLVYAIDFFLQNNYSILKHADWAHIPDIETF